MTTDPSLFQAPLRIGTRGSDLALWQSNHVRDRLRHQWGPQLEVELEVISTKGDQIQDRPLHEVGGKGLFVKAIEQRLIDGQVDIAVHSMKDMPAVGPRELAIACTPIREDPRDALVGVDNASLCLRELAAGTRVGTGSLRRSALIQRINPGVVIVPIRGNVPTRVAKVDAGEVDVVMLAAAGLKRLGLGARIGEVLDVDAFCPSPAQGVLALQCRRDDARAKTLLEALSHRETSICAAAERAFLVRLGASCTVPVGCHARLDGDTLRVHGLVVDPSGEPCFAAENEGPAQDATLLGRALAESLLAAGAGCVADLGASSAQNNTD